MASLVCGSLAYDVIMSFDGYFHHQILENQIHELNVSFLISKMRKEFGGCAGNIAYNLSLLGGTPIIIGTLGNDSDSYYEKFHKFNIITDHILKIETALTAQAVITTDLNGNQITCFYPGAMNDAHVNCLIDIMNIRLKNKKEIPKLAILSPDGRKAMIDHCEQISTLNIPFIFDPGQGISMFNGDALLYFIKKSTYLIVNFYESQILLQRTEMSIKQISQLVKAFIITKGALGSEIYTPEKKISIPAVFSQSVIDPTGCGDAFRGGLLFGLEKNFDWETTARLASLMGSLKVSHQGSQNHYHSQEQIAEKFKTIFGYDYQ